MSPFRALGGSYYEIDNRSHLFRTDALCKLQSHARSTRLLSNKRFLEVLAALHFLFLLVRLRLLKLCFRRG
jgi:hypothetical protein